MESLIFGQEKAWEYLGGDLDDVADLFVEGFEQFQTVAFGDSCFFFQYECYS